MGYLLLAVSIMRTSVVVRTPSATERCVNTRYTIGQLRTGHDVGSYRCSAIFRTPPKKNCVSVSLGL